MRAMLFALPLMALCACGSQRVVTRLKLPPRVQALGTPTTLHLDPLAGPRGGAATRTLSLLIQTGRHHTLTQGPGQVRVSGTVQPDAHTEEHSTGEDRRCVSRTKKGGCTRYVKVPIHRLAESCTVRLDGQITRADGQILAARSFTGSRSREQASEKGRPPSSADALCTEAADEATRAFAAFVTPMEARVALDFRTVDDPGERTRQGISLAERGRFEEASTTFATVAANQTLEPEQRGWSHYNQAVALWALAAFGPCVEALDRAAETVSAPEITTMRTACAEYLQ
ncbi:MAG: hypothetical protein KC549_18830 [Myxococcales bacterium]|nr:hypothetical protein [Myxococcales bacterium]MCB9550034.1 hypothetical protein [Myxococcales bacterium]